jgi:hypothetical protein
MLNAHRSTLATTSDATATSKATPARTHSMRWVLSGVGRRCSRPSRSRMITPAGSTRSRTPALPADSAREVPRQPLTRTTGRIVRVPISKGSPTIRSEILEHDRNRCRIGVTTLTFQCIGKGGPRSSVPEPTTGGGNEYAHREHQQQRRARKHDPQNEMPQRAASSESALATCPDRMPPFPSSHLTLRSYSPGCVEGSFSEVHCEGTV